MFPVNRFQHSDLKNIHRHPRSNNEYFLNITIGYLLTGDIADTYLNHMS